MLPYNMLIFRYLMVAARWAKARRKFFEIAKQEGSSTEAAGTRTEKRLALGPILKA